MASHDGGRKSARSAGGARARKCLVLVCINLSNLVCHSVYSVLASFFPQEARAKGLSDEYVGLVFAIFAAVIFVAAPFVTTALSRHGKRHVYIAGLAIVAGGTMAFAMADQINSLPAYFCWCFVLRCVQGFGSALEETAAYALIADIDPEAVSFNLGITEISTGLGYMVGPTIGGLLFSAGGFAAPFVCIGVALLPAMLLIYTIVPDDALARRAAVAAGGQPREPEPTVPLSQLLMRPQILVIATTAILGNSDYAFLEPTLAAHVESVAPSSTSIGMLFSVTSATYTLASPLMGWVSHKQRLGPRNVITVGTALQCLGFLVIGPSPLLRFLFGGAAALEEEPTISLPLICLALFLFGLGEAMSMTPLMEDMMLSCIDRKHDVINSLSALMTSCFSLGQMVGPLLGSFLAARVGFAWASTGIGVLLAAQTGALIYLQRLSRPHQFAGYDCASLLAPTLSGSATPRELEQNATELAGLTAVPQEMLGGAADLGDADALADGASNATDDDGSLETTHLQRHRGGDRQLPSPSF